MKVNIPKYRNLSETVTTQHKRRKVIYNGNMYRPNYSKGKRWLQIIIFNILDRLDLKTPYYKSGEEWFEVYEKEVPGFVFEQQTIDFRSIADAISEYEDTLHQIHFSHQTRVIIMGSEPFVSAQSEMAHAFHMNIDYMISEPSDYNSTGWGGKHKIKGVDVILVPWFDGILMLPEGVMVTDVTGHQKRGW